MTRAPLRAVAVAACAVAFLVLASGVALGHANYVKSNPASDARLAKAPSEVRISFSETPDPAGSDIAVLDTQGTRKNGTTVASVTDEPNTLRTAVPNLPDGGYVVSWKARSAVDGHETQGAFAFVIGTGPLPSIPDIGPSSPPPAPLELAGRMLAFAGVAITLGAAFFVLFIWGGGERRRERWLITAGGGLLILGTLVLLAAYGLSAPPRLLLFLLLRAAAGVVAIGAAWLPDARVPADARREVIAFAGLAAGLWVTLVSHAAAIGEPLGIAADFIHVVAVSIWSGGVLALLVLAIPAQREPRVLGATVWRFSVTALVCVAVIVTTGTLQALGRLVLWEDLYETPYGIALLAKIVMLLALVSLGSLNLLVWGPRLRDGIAARGGLLRGVAIETVLFACVLGAAAFLTALPYPAQNNGVAYDQTQRVDGIRMELLVPTTNPGRNRYVVRVTQGLQPVTNAEQVSFRFTMVEHDMGVQDLIATERAPGEYVAEGSPTAMFGTWKVQTIVRLPGRLDISALFTVPIANNSGQIAQVLPIPAPPAAALYNMIVFSDPAQPQANAPVTINVVLVDAKGDPVQGKKVNATFDGPGTQAPIAATEDPANTGPGRYKVGVPALPAGGTWKITLAVGNEGSGVYTLEVAR
ncbi:MAG TPA: copper resistance protein CopC [Candidatus Acidoferrales bacterium]|nr:copper resistance protein CopC [Candidatus Acidoferrales bacterium]